MIPGLPPPFLHTASDQKLDGGKAWEGSLWSRLGHCTGEVFDVSRLSLVCARGWLFFSEVTIEWRWCSYCVHMGRVSHSKKCTGRQSLNHVLGRPLSLAEDATEWNILITHVTLHISWRYLHSASWIIRILNYTNPQIMIFINVLLCIKWKAIHFVYKYHRLGNFPR